MATYSSPSTLACVRLTLTSIQIADINLIDPRMREADVVTKSNCVVNFNVDDINYVVNFNINDIIDDLNFIVDAQRIG